VKRAAELNLVAERAHLRLVGRQHADEELLGGLLQRSMLAVMLAEKSSVTTAVNGCVSFSKTVTFWRLAVVQNRELVSIEVRDEAALGVETVVNRGTNWVPERKWAAVRRTRLLPAATRPRAAAAAMTRAVTASDPSRCHEEMHTGRA
jgi:hypothetical protein